MDTAEIREKTLDELKELDADLRRQLFKARFDNHTNALDDTASIGRLRRDIARVATILTEKQAQE